MLSFLSGNMLPLMCIFFYKTMRIIVKFHSFIKLHTIDFGKTRFARRRRIRKKIANRFRASAPVSAISRVDLCSGRFLFLFNLLFSF